MRSQFVIAILKKELLETIRDKKTLLINIVLPMVVWPLTAAFVTQYSATQILRQQEKISHIMVVGDLNVQIRDRLAANDRLEIIEPKEPISWVSSPSTPADNAGHPNPAAEALEVAAADAPSPPLQVVERLIETDEIQAIVVGKFVPPSAGSPQNDKVWVVYDSTNGDSAQAGERIADVLEELRQEWIDCRLEESGLTKEILEPLTIAKRNVATKAKKMHDVLGRFLPLILIFLVILGGFYPAIATTAGEKEHGTLPTLLCAPITHLELLAGKYLAVLLIASMGVTANILSISCTAVVGLTGTQLQISPTILLIIFLVLIPTVMLYTGLFMAVAMFANNFREGQNLLSPVTIVAVLPAYSTMLPGVKLNLITAITPGFNIALLIRELLLQSARLEFVFLTLMSNIAWTVGILVLAAKIFRTEELLLSGESGITALFTTNRNALPQPTPQLSTALFLVYLSGTFYLSGMLLRFGIQVLIPVLQIGLCAGVSLCVAWYFRMDLAAVFRLRRPHPLALIGAVLVGATMFVVTHWISRLTPAPEAYKTMFADALQLQNSDIGLPTLLLLIAILPGVCEEIAFRGILLSGFLNGLSARWAVLITGLCFACAHFSVFNFLALLAIGIVLSFAAWWTQSLWVSVIIHIMNNGLAVILMRYEHQLSPWLDFGEQGIIRSIIVTAVGCAIAALGVGMLYWGGKKTRDGCTRP